MFNLLNEIIGFASETDITKQQEILLCGCLVMIIVLTVVLIDAIFKVFRNFWR